MIFCVSLIRDYRTKKWIGGDIYVFCRFIIVMVWSIVVYFLFEDIKWFRLELLIFIVVNSVEYGCKLEE